MTKDHIAIIGMACKFPGGANNLATFWKNLINKIDGICDQPKDRSDFRKFYHPNRQKPGKAYVKKGGYLQENITQFDPLFFGISPREIESIDIQQRYLMECAWEAIEDAGLPLQQLQELKTSVFIGGFTLDNMLLQLDQHNMQLIDNNTAVSFTMALLANRLSYIFDLKGPSIAMDTACSSSLTATHMACQSIWNNESDIAMVGGVNIILQAKYSTVMSKGGFLSEHGFCKAFSEEASGYTRGEGAGIVILKPYQKALHDGDTIYALIRETGINQDGRTSGISLPNGEAQKLLIRDVCKRARIHPSEISYVEAHGTGTQAGDMTETSAINDVLKEERDVNSKVLIGSVKTNIGHLEAAAGVAGLIKAALCLKHKKIVPNLHFDKPNPKIRFEEMCIQVPVEVHDWDIESKTRFALVNSFGYGGSNANVLLEEVPEQKTVSSQRTEAGPFFICLSTRNENALRVLAKNYHEMLLNDNDLTLSDLSYSTCMRRSHLSHRMAVVVTDKQSLCASLKEFANKEPAQEIFFDVAQEKLNPRSVFVYTGMGPQWQGMGVELFKQEPHFAATVRKCEQLFQKITGKFILSIFVQPEQETGLPETIVMQVSNFIIQVALTELLKLWGITPHAVIGHSVGEIAAAYVCGALTLEDALLITYHRSYLQNTQKGNGGMLAAALSEDDAKTILAEYPNIDIAAINSPNSVTFSGDQAQLKQFATYLDQKGIFNRALKVDVAYHSYQMNAIELEFKNAISTIKPKHGVLPFYSTVTGELLAGDKLDANYWWRNLRESVKYAAACFSLLQDGYVHFLEVGPHPVLSSYTKECMSQKNINGSTTQTLNRKTSEIITLMKSIAKLYSHGFIPNWETLLPTKGTYIKLPNYPWQKESYWRESQVSKENRLGAEDHVFCNSNLRLPYPAWEVELNDLYFPFLNDHKVQGNVVFPGACYVEAGLTMGEKLFPQKHYQIENLQFHKMLVIQETTIQSLNLHVNMKTNEYSVYSCHKSDSPEWQLNASGHISMITGQAIEVSFNSLKQNCPKEIDKNKLYHSLQKMGLEYGDAFRSIQQIWVGDKQVLAHLVANKLEEDTTYFLNPPLLDGAFQALIAIINSDIDNVTQTYVPAKIKRIKFYHSPGLECWSYATITNGNNKFIEADIFLFNDQGLCVELNGVRLSAISYSYLDTVHEMNHLFYEYQWQEMNLERALNADINKKWLILSNTESEGKNLRQLVNEQGIIAEFSNFSNLEDITKDGEYSRVVFLYTASYTLNIEQLNAETILESIMPVVTVIKDQNKYGKQNIHINIISELSQAVSAMDDVKNLAAAPLWNLGLLIENEFPGIVCKLIDVDKTTSELEIFAEIVSNSKERNVAYRNHKRFVRRLVHTDLNKLSAKLSKKNVAKHAVELDITQLGSPDNIFYKEIERKIPGNNEVEIRVYAVPLNFKDLLKIYGQLAAEVTENTFFGDTIGMEMVGVVVSVGNQVKHLKPGDSVVSTFPGCFRSYVTVPVSYVEKIPKQFRFSDISYLVYMTAYYGLVNVANLREGEKILIHNATGGVGLAAIQIAQWKKATIYATAGTEKKREYLRSLGIQFVYDSRSLLFHDEILRDTNQYGVDVVINAISGNALYKSFEILAPFGRFIEIGKKDIGENNGLPMRTFNRNILFAGIDIDRMFIDKITLAQELLANVTDCFEKGIFHSIPVSEFKAQNTADAFRFMAQGKHIGKVVITYHDDDEVLAESLVGLTNTIHNAGTYLVTGGTSGFGLIVAKWLANQGARNLLLISRSGVKTSEANAILTDLQHNGVKVLVKSVDISSSTQVERMMNEIQAEMPPLRGIIHSAMVLDDGFLVDLTPERFLNVFQPKISGAINLHNHTKNYCLDFFVLFSSVSSMLGNPGQANYVLANGFLDAFAHFRNAQGLPATTINWGVFTETGVVSRNAAIKHSITNAGINGFSNQQALDTLKVAMEKNFTQIGIFDVDWKQLMKMNSNMQNIGIFEELIEQENNAVNKSEQISKILLPLDMTQRQNWIETKLKMLFSKIFKISPENMMSNQSISNLGIDSLMGVEIVTLIQSEFSIKLNVVDLLKGPTLAQLATLLLGRIMISENELIDKIEELSEEEIDALLTAQTN